MGKPIVKFTPITHQFSLFDFNTMRPKTKIPISKKTVLEGKALMQKGDNQGAASKMREVREALEDFESRINTNLHKQ